MGASVHAGRGHRVGALDSLRGLAALIVVITTPSPGIAAAAVITGVRSGARHTVAGEDEAWRAVRTSGQSWPSRRSR